MATNALEQNTAIVSSTNTDVTWEGPAYAKLRPIVFGYAMFPTLFAACELDLFKKLS